MAEIKQLTQLKDNQTIVFKIQSLLKEILKKNFDLEIDHSSIDINQTQDQKFGDYACNIALKFSKELGKNPREIASTITNDELLITNFISKTEIAGPGFINFFIDQDYYFENLKKVLEENETYGKWNIASGKVMCEFGSPNAYKSLHIGHLRNTITGLSTSRLLENLGYKVISANFPSDIGMHVAKSIWAYLQRGGKPENFDSLTSTQKLNYIVDCYVDANKKFKEDEEVKAEIQDINKKVFFKTDDKLVSVYQQLLAWSFDYLNDFFNLLNIKHDKQYPESSVVEEGKELVTKHVGTIFKEDEGAVIFEGEPYGLHTSVFLTGNEIPTYAAKDLALAYKKFRDFPDLEFSTVFTAVEQIDHFKVVIKALELIDSKFIGKYYHLAYGWVLNGGKKASTKLGNTVDAFDFITESTNYALERIASSKEYDEETSKMIAEHIGLAGLKFLFLSHEFHKDINYNPEQFMNPEGFSGPYIMYGYVRTQSILRQAENYALDEFDPNIEDIALTESELSLLKILSQFPNATLNAGKNIAPHIICNYIFELTQAFNLFYRENKVLVEDADIRSFRLHLTKAVGIVLKNGLNLLGIDTIEQM